MPIKTHHINFDREKAVESATTQNQNNAVTTLACAATDPESGGPPDDWRQAYDSSEPRANFQFIVGGQRMRVDQPRLKVHRPQLAVLTELDGAVVRMEFYDGHDQLECADDVRSAAPGEDLPKWMERDPLNYDPVAFLAEYSGTRPENGTPAFQAIRDPDTPGFLAPSSSEPSLSRQPDDTIVPMTLLDRRVPQRGWEHEYGVPSYLIGAADVLFYHRKRVANPDAAVIDSAILRLYGPWIRRDAASSPVTSDVRS